MTDEIIDPPGPRSAVLTPKARRRFARRYVLAKTVWLWRDVRRPRLRLFVYEVVYSLCRALGRPTVPLNFLHLDRVTTVFGDFHVRPGTIDAACVSPAFERDDVDHLLDRTRAYLAQGRRVLFLDVGADVGTYAVTVGNRLGAVGGPDALRVVAFEPASSSYALTSANVELNGLGEIVDARNMALGDGSVTSAVLRFDPAEPGGSGLHETLVEGSVEEEVSVSTIDKEVGADAAGRVVVAKLDVEGAETEVLEGAKATLAAADEALLLVEDFVDTSIIGYLERTGWTLVDKRTPYNSFWVRRGDDARDRDLS